MEERIQIVLIDQHQLFREGIKLILESNDAFQIVAESDQYEVLNEVSSLFDIDIVLMDVHLLKENLTEMKEKIYNHETKVIVLANKGEESFVTKAVKVGVHGFLFREMEKIPFVQAIKMVKEGEAYIHPEATHSLVEDYRKLMEEENEESEKGFEVDRPYHLYTKRECEILQLLTDGQSNRRIAETLDISEKTVKNHVSSLFKKMQVHDRTQAVVMAIRNNWVQL